MESKVLARTAAVIVLAGSVLACAIEVAQRNLASGSSTPPADNKIDPLAGELARCKALGAEAAHDDACNAAWAQNRARFLSPGAPLQNRSIDLFPATPDVPNETRGINVDPAPAASQSDGGAPGTDPERP